jgi:hypothetical protein
MSNRNSSTVVFPLPIELLETFTRPAATRPAEEPDSAS